MRLKLFSIAALAIFQTIPAHAQQSVCDLFKDLESHDGAQVVVRGELFLDGERAALAETTCGPRFRSNSIAIELAPSARVPRNQLAELKSRAAEIKKLDADGQTVVAYGTFSGRLMLQTNNTIPAKLTFDDARDVTVEALPPAKTLPVIPICDLFQNLVAFKGQRVAVRAENVSTMEGSWLSGNCDSNFITGGHHWPVSISLGVPDYYGPDSSLFRIHEDRRPPNPPGLQSRNNVASAATYVGLLQIKDKYEAVCRPDGSYVAYGYGHLGGAAAELIVESVYDAEVLTRRQVRDTEPDPPCEPPNHAQLCASSTSLFEAATDNCPDRVRELLASQGIDAADGGPSAALTAAIRSGHESVVALLIQAGAPVNPATTYDWLKPFFVALNWRRHRILEALVKAGVDVNQKDRDGAPWLPTSGNSDTQASKILLAAGADPNGRDSLGGTALMYASGQGDDEEVKLLLEHHADVNLKDAKGRTALMYATVGQYVAAIPLLLAHGADPLWRDNDGLTALDLAKKSGNDVAVRLLSAPESRAVPNSIH
ncbi:MAG: ankyrin repeat domain-containing protein [Bryobacteraceae bacterium]